jgi:hypothetical protein
MRVWRPAPLAISAALAFLLPSSTHAQPPFPIVALVVEGDTVAGIGQINTIDNLAVNSDGDWLVEADTTNPDTDADSVLLRTGALYLREGDPLADPPGADIDTFDSINLNAQRDSGWNFFLGGLPGDRDSGVFFNTDLLIQEGGRSLAPEFGPETIYLGFFEVKINDVNQLSIVASVDDPAIPGSLERAIVRATLDGGGTLLSESVVAEEGDVLPGQTDRRFRNRAAPVGDQQPRPGPVLRRPGGIDGDGWNHLSRQSPRGPGG